MEFEPEDSPKSYMIQHPFDGQTAASKSSSSSTPSSTHHKSDNTHHYEKKFVTGSNVRQYSVRD